MHSVVSIGSRCRTSGGYVILSRTKVETVRNVETQEEAVTLTGSRVETYEGLGGNEDVEQTTKKALSFFTEKSYFLRKR